MKFNKNSALGALIGYFLIIFILELIDPSKSFIGFLFVADFGIAFSIFMGWFMAQGEEK